MQSVPTPSDRTSVNVNVDGENTENYAEVSHQIYALFSYKNVSCVLAIDPLILRGLCAYKGPVKIYWVSGSLTGGRRLLFD